MTQRRKDHPESMLLVTDSKNSVQRITGSSNVINYSYSAYGYEPSNPTSVSLLGFNGEPRSATGCYSLGNGYRIYSPALMRFSSPDDMSPFGSGGINAYSYCAGDPINYVDPSGHMMRANRRQLPRETEIKLILQQNEKLQSDIKQIDVNLAKTKEYIDNAPTRLSNIDANYGIGSRNSAGQKVKISERDLESANTKKMRLAEENQKKKADYNLMLATRRGLIQQIKDLNTTLAGYQTELGTDVYNRSFSAAQSSLVDDTGKIRS